MMNLSNKEYKIFRFDVYAQITKSKDEDALLKLRWKYANEFTEFQVELINKFCSETWDALNRKYTMIDPVTKTFPKYKKSWIMGSFDIGMDMVAEETGLLMEHHWMYVYFKVPIANKEMIEFFESKTFSFNVKTVKRI